MRPPTIRDVARHAGVGVATVSRVLNNSPSVAEDTRQRVLAAIETLKYTPNPIAKQLSSGRTYGIAVTLPFLAYPSFVERLRGVQQALADTEYELILYAADTPHRREMNFWAMSQKPRADGVLIISVPMNDSHVQMFLSSNLPTVLVDIYNPDFHRVFVDDVEGGMLATRHLLELGHRKIAFIGDELDDEFEFLAMRQRYRGYCRALGIAGIDVRPEYHGQRPHGREEGCEMTRELLMLPDPPTAIVAGSDTQAIGALDAAAELGLNVPHELSIVGYDGIRDAEYLNLTTVEQPLYDSGVEGVRLLLQVLESPALDPLEVRLPIRLLERGTSAPPAS